MFGPPFSTRLTIFLRKHAGHFKSKSKDAVIQMLECIRRFATVARIRAMAGRVFDERRQGTHFPAVPAVPAVFRTVDQPPAPAG